jgi:hypothetical protein
VTNGTFDTDLTGWYVGASGTRGNITWSNGAVVVDNSITTYNSAVQEITTEIGKVYSFKADLVAVTGSSTAIAIAVTNNSAGTGAYAVNNNLSIGENELFFVAQQATTYIVVAAGLSTDTTYDNISVREINPLSVSIAMMGEMDYADEGLAVQVDFMQWNKGDGLNYILHRLRTTDARVGEVRFFQAEGGTVDTINSDADAYSPDLNVPFNIASRHGSTFVNGAVDSIALTADTTPVALPDLSTTDLKLAFKYNGTISEFRIFDRDIGDTGISEATKPSLEPSLSLTFDGQPSSFTNTGLTV